MIEIEIERGYNSVLMIKKQDRESKRGIIKRGKGMKGEKRRDGRKEVR